MIASVSVFDEVIKWAIPAGGAGILAVIRLMYQALRKLDVLGEKVADLHHYTRYHLGPNGEATPIHTRLGALERVHDLEVGP